MVVTKITLLLLWSFVLVQTADVLVFVGPSGAGKSSMVNFVDGSNVAEEGHSLYSCTQGPLLYCHTLGACSLDTQGTGDTEGKDDSEIWEMIRQVVAEQIAKGNTIKGIYLMQDGTEKKWRLRPLVVSAMQTFGDGVLPSLGFVVNRDLALTPADREVIRTYVINQIGHLIPAEELDRRVIFLDTKGDRDPYLALLLALPTAPLSPSAPTSIYDEIERRTRVALESPENYEETVVTTQSVVYTTVTKQTVLKVPYTYECNCHKRCVRRFIGACISRKWVCDQCASTRDQPHSYEEQVPHVVTDFQTIRRRKNEYEAVRIAQKAELLLELQQIVVPNH